MKKYGFTVIAATAALVGLAAPAAAAPAGAGSAQDVISTLESQGYDVVVNRLSNVPLTEADVVSVGTGPTFSHTESLSGAEEYTDYDRQFTPENVTTVYVNVR